MKIVRGVSSFPAAKAAQGGEDQHFSYDVQKLVSRKCSGIKAQLGVALQRTCYYLRIFMEGHFFFLLLHGSSFRLSLSSSFFLHLEQKF